MVRDDKIVLGINLGNQLSVIIQWCHRVKFRGVGISFNGSIEVNNYRVSLVGLSW